MVLAYRLGQLPDIDRPKERVPMPQGPRLSLSEAARVTLPDGTLFGEASQEQVYGWFVRLLEQVGASRTILGLIFEGLDLACLDDRWYALNEILELGSVRDVFEGKVREPSVIRQNQGGMTRAALEAVLRQYGLSLALTRRGNGLGSVYAQSNTKALRVKFYVCTLSALEEGRLTEALVRAKVEAKLPPRKEVAA